MTEDTKQVLICAIAGTIIFGTAVTGCTVQTVSLEAGKISKHEAQEAQYKNGCAKIGHSHKVKVD